MGIFANILVGYDGSPGAERALLLAAELAGAHGAALTLLSVVEHVPRFPGTIDEVDETIREQAEALRERQRHGLALAAEHGVVSRNAIIEVGHAAQLIVAYAEHEHADLLVIGRSGHSQVWGRFMGGTADKISRHAPCSVLVAH